MTTTLLVGANERYEEVVELATVVLQSPLTDMPDGLSDAQVAQLLDLLAPTLLAQRLAKFDQLTLTYLVDGIPMRRQCWTRDADSALEPLRGVTLELGKRLYLSFDRPLELQRLSL